MSDTPETPVDENVTDPKAELASLKQIADTMGVTYHPSIGVDSLRKKINEARAVPAEEEPETPEAETAEDGDEDLTPAQHKIKKRAELRAEKLRLIRCRITNMNPSKARLNGEFITVANKVIGTQTKFIPFGEATDEGWHVPKVIYDALQAKQFQQIKVTKDRQTGKEKIESRWVKEYAIEVLEPLTREQLDRLALEQKAAGS